ERAAHAQLQIFPDTIENNDRIIGRETDDGQDGGDSGRIKLAASQKITAERHQNVMNDGQHSSDGKGEFVPKGHINENTEKREQAGDDRRPWISAPMV